MSDLMRIVDTFFAALGLLAVLTWVALVVLAVAYPLLASSSK